MSTIMKALRRLEEDKRAEPSAVLEERVVEMGRAPIRVGTGLVALAAVLGAGMIGFAIYRAATTDAAPAGVAVSPEIAATSPAAPARAEPPVTVLEAPPEELVDRTPPGPEEDSVTVVLGSAEPAAAAGVPEPEPVRDAGAGSAPEPPPAVEPPVSVASEPAVTVSPTVESPIPVEVQAASPKVAAAPVRSARRADLRAEPEPARRPQAVRVGDLTQAAATPPEVLELAAPVESVVGPRFTVTQTIWHPTRERRVAVVDLNDGADARRVHEGDVVAGYTVVSIGLSSVELARGGEIIDRRVGAP